MKPRFILGLALGIGLLAGFVLGSAPSAGESQAGGHEASAKTAESLSRPAEANADSPRRDDAKTQRPPRKPAEARVSIPIGSVVESLRKNQFQIPHFESLMWQMPQALMLLGVDEEQQQAVAALMKDIRAQIIAAEKQHVKVSTAADGKVVFDQSAMVEPSKEIIVKFQDGLRSNLPADVAGALIEAIEWDRFYEGGTDDLSSSIQITRTPRGLMALLSTQGFGTRQTLPPDKYPDDGTPIPLQQIYAGTTGGDRWVALLGDMKLLPTDEAK